MESLLSQILKNKVAFITGANRGIGKKIAQLFASNGSDLILHSRKKGNLDSFLIELMKYKINVQPLYFDNSNVNEINENLKNIRKYFSSVDILVNNAGIQRDGLLGMIPNEMIIDTFSTNVFSNIIISQWVSRLMMKNNSGSIINISSIMGTHGAKGQAVYSSSKAAINGLTLSLSKELAPLNIRVNAIAPGFIKTDMTSQLSEVQYKSRMESIRMKRIGLPEDIANLALFLASESSNYITGQVIHVDGGMKI
jgi:3-oxoacyl-[acyl-carrier protein] reductase